MLPMHGFVNLLSSILVLAVVIKVTAVLMVLDYQKVKNSPFCQEVLPTCIRSFNRWFSPDMWVMMTDLTGRNSL